MGLANILRVLRRHLLVSSLVLGVTLVAAAAFYVLTPTQYETTSSFVLFPGAIPTDQLFANHPEYVGRNSDNPYLNGGDVATATAVLIQTMQSDDVRKQLVAEGADREYVVAIDNSVLSGGQMITVTGTGTSTAAAEHTAQVVNADLPRRLAAMQTINGAEAPFLITARQTLSPDEAVAKTSGKLRSVVVIVVGGFGVLFGALTVLEALAAARAQRATDGRDRKRRRGRRVDGETGPAPAALPASSATPGPTTSGAHAAAPATTGRGSAAPGTAVAAPGTAVAPPGTAVAASGTAVAPPTGPAAGAAPTRTPAGPGPSVTAPPRARPAAESAPDAVGARRAAPVRPGARARPATHPVTVTGRRPR